VDEHQKIHLALAFDQNYIVPIYTLLTSIFDNNRKNSIVFHVIATGLSKLEKDSLRLYVNKNNSEIHFYEIEESHLAALVLNEGDHFTVAAYYRLFFPLLVPAEVKKLLYLDTDIIVLGDLMELYQTEIGEVPVAVALDVNIGPRPDLGVEDGYYFNSGVLLINIPEWRAQCITEKALKFMQDFPEKIKWVDQDALNGVLLKNFKILESRFNLTIADIPEDLPKRSFKHFLQDKIVIHFTTANKPWFGHGVNKFRYLYHYYLMKSPHPFKSKYIDFKWESNYLKKFIKIRLIENLYYNYPFVGRGIRKLKKKVVRN
jgi:lipopolysaccharide biosynthesis glycosyltransferase